MVWGNENCMQLDDLKERTSKMGVNGAIILKWITEN
jgi:hypothetical protein